MAETYKVTRADGSVIEREFGSNRVVSEKDPEGKSVARILVKTSESGNIVESKPVETAKEFSVSTKAQTLQEEANIQTRDTMQEARVVVSPEQRTATITAMPSRTKQIAQERLQQRSLSPDYLRRSDFKSPTPFLETEEGKKSIKAFSYRLANPEKFEGGEDTRLILSSTKEKLTTLGIGAAGAGSVAGGIALEPLTAGGSTVLIAGGGALLSKAAARTSEGVFGATLSPKEKELITSEAFVESFSTAIFKSQEKFRKENPIIVPYEIKNIIGEGTVPIPTVSIKGAAKRTAGTLNVGISASPEDFGTFFTEELEKRGFSPSEIETGVRLGQERRTVGVASDVLETVGAGVGAEFAATKTLIKGGAKSLSEKVVVTGVVGAIEAPALTTSQARITGVNITPAEVGISSLIGAATAGTVTGVIGKTGVAGKVIGGKTGKKVGEEFAEKTFYAFDPSEAIVDFTTSAAEKTAGKRKRVVAFSPTFSDTSVSDNTFNIISQTTPVQKFEGFGVGTVTGVAPKTPSRVKAFSAIQPKQFEPSSFIQPETTPKETPITDVRTETESFVDAFVGSKTSPMVKSNVQARSNPLINSRVSSRVTVFEGGVPPFFKGRKGGDGGFGFGTLSKGREKDYVASLAAVSFNIEGEKSEIAELTGLGIRPLKKRKSKRKKK